MSQTSALPGPDPARWPASRVPGAPKFSVLMVSGLLGAAIPLILSLYWIAFWLAPESLGAPLRISVAGCSVLLGSFWYRAELSHAEVLLFRVLTVAAVVWLIPTLLANDPAHALLGWIKLVILFTVCCFTTASPTYCACVRLGSVGWWNDSWRFYFIHVCEVSRLQRADL